MSMTTTTTNITWEACDAIPNCIAIANGRRYDVWCIFDRVALVWGDKAEIMRNCLKPGTPRFEVEFPDKERRSYATLASARRAVEHDANRKYTY